MEDSANANNDLEMRLSGRNEGPIAVGMDKSSKSPKCKKCEEQMQRIRDNVVINNEAIKQRTLSNDNGDRCGKDGRYPMRNWRPFGKQWKNCILSQQHQKMGQCGIFR